MDTPLLQSVYLDALAANAAMRPMQFTRLGCQCRLLGNHANAHCLKI